MYRCISIYSMAVLLLIASAVSFAEGFGINATRLIYPESEKSISVTLRNTMKDKPYLVQVTTSTEQDKMVLAPFVITPPLFRLEPESINQVRIALVGETLPKDRESVFYFVATGIPGSSTRKSEQQNDNINGMVQFGVGNIIKIFYRPDNLNMSSSQAQNNLTFTKVNTGVQVSNNSPYYVNLSGLNFSGKKVVLDTLNKKMISPFSNYIYETPVQKGSVSWQTINDAGGVDEHKNNF